MAHNNRLDWDLIMNGDKITISFFGKLTRFTLDPLWKKRHQFLSEFKKNPNIILWDFNKLSHIDSAGFALICELLHQGETLGIKQKLINSPQQLLTLADLFGFSNWFSAFLPQAEK